MARTSKKTVENEVRRIVRRQIKRRGGIGMIFLLAALFCIGLFNPELRDRVAQTLLPGSTNSVLSPEDNEPLSSKTKSPLKEGVWPVVHVVDGDTLDVQDDTGTKHRIRFIGSDTPEVVKPNHPVEPFGPEASAFTKQMIAESGNKVRVAFDGDQIDRYGRNLAMIYIQRPEGEVCLNELLLREGLAVARLQYRFSKGAKQRMQQAEDEAKAARRNIWSNE